VVLKLLPTISHRVELVPAKKMLRSLLLKRLFLIWKSVTFWRNNPVIPPIAMSNMHPSIIIREFAVPPAPIEMQSWLVLVELSDWKRQSLITYLSCLARLINDCPVEVEKLLTNLQLLIVTSNAAFPPPLTELNRNAS